MITNITSDIASNMRLSMRGIELRSALDEASMELASGQKSDLADATQGSVDTIFAIDKKLKNIEVFRTTIDLAEARSSMAQSSLEQVSGILGTLGVDILAAIERDDLVSAKVFSQQSNVLLTSTINALNVQVGGQALFSGAAFDQQAIASSGTIKADLQALVSAAPDVTTAMNDINFYFNDPAGGFATSSYGGSTTDAPHLSIADGVDLNPFLRADNESLRNAVRIVAVAALVSDGAFAGDPDSQKAMLKSIAEDSIGVRDNITYLRQDVGDAQGLIAEIAAQNSAERSTLEITRNNLTGADPFEAATRVTELQTQLESLYLLTARLSGLSLANYLR